MAEIWGFALADPDLEAVLREVHTGLLEEQTGEAVAAAVAVLTIAVKTHLPSAAIVHTSGVPVTVGDVAEELFRHTPDRLPAEARSMHHRVRLGPDR